MATAISTSMSLTPTLSISSSSTSSQTTVSIYASNFGSLYGYSLAFSNLPSTATTSIKNNINNWTPSTVSQNQTSSLVAADFSLSNPIDTSSQTLLATLSINQTGFSSPIDFSTFSLTFKNAAGAFTDVNLKTLNYNLTINGSSNFIIHDTQSANTYTANTSNLSAGSGVETIVYPDAISNYTVTRQPKAFSVTNKTSGLSDTVTGFSRIKFSDAGYAYDTNGAAGMVAKILGAVFGADSITNSTYVGIGLKLFDQGSSYQDVINLAMNVQLGSGYSNSAEVALLYKNLIHALPSAQDSAMWVNQIVNKTYTQVSLAQFACDSAFNTDNIALSGLAQTGLLYV